MIIIGNMKNEWITFKILHASQFTGEPKAIRESGRL